MKHDLLNPGNVGILWAVQERKILEKFPVNPKQPRKEKEVSNTKILLWYYNCFWFITPDGEILGFEYSFINTWTNTKMILSMCYRRSARQLMRCCRPLLYGRCHATRSIIDGHKQQNTLGSLCELRHCSPYLIPYPDSKVHGADMGPTWGREDPGGTHVSPVKFAICVGLKLKAVDIIRLVMSFTHIEWNKHELRTLMRDKTNSNDVFNPDSLKMTGVSFSIGEAAPRHVL